MGDVELYKAIYQPLLMEVITVPSPDCYERAPGETWAEHSRRKFAHMEAALARHAHEVAAVIVEPLVQCAGGMRMYDPVYLQLLREACDRHQVHLIADEIAVGFGRTGTLFACEQAGDPPGLHVPVQGADRRLPAALGGADHRGRVRGVLRRVREAQRLPALAQLHRQSARLRGGTARALHIFASPTMHRAQPRRSPRTWARAPRRSPTTRTWPRYASTA